MTPEDIHREGEQRQVRIDARLAEMEHRLTQLEVTLWGRGGENGLRGTLLDLRRKLDMLLRFFWVATAIPPLTVAVLAVLKFLGKL